MPTSQILPLTRFRGRRERRRDLVWAFHATDRHRDRLLRHLWRALELIGADRAAAVWIDEYGPGLVHPHVVLDMAFDRPRTDFSAELLRRTWGRGVPGVLDAPDPGRLGQPSLPGTEPPRSAFVVSLGSDGLRAWFMVVDSLTPRPLLSPEDVEELLFRAGECAGVLLHRDMDVPEGRPAPEDGAWPVLRDAADLDADPDRNRRVACRFVLTRLIRTFVEDDLVMAPDELEERVAGVKAEVADFPPDDPERRSWDRVLAALRPPDLPRLSEALVVLAGVVEERGHWHGAAELYDTAREVAAAASAPEAWSDAARGVGRVRRKLGEWDEAVRWYQRSREVAGVAGDRARVIRGLDGLATVHIVRGNMPLAREILDEAVPLAEGCGDADARASVYHSLMTVAHTRGDLGEAARHGWRAVREFEDEDGRLRALTALGGVFLEARELGAAEDAFSVVAARVRDRVFRLYALAGLAVAAAHRRRRDDFLRRLAVLDEAGFGEGPPEFRAEALLEFGDGFLVLGDDEAARDHYRRAVEVAAEYGVNEYLIRAEEALARLDRVATGDPSREETPVEVPAAALGPPELDEIRSDLRRLRGEMVPEGVAG